ncbi:2-hydroxyacid dehydrogenase [Pseudomonas sp. 5P_3.1_Bac2]|uniref:2-hydroxyacid dehydrogenase n=1 Tax=Pseudomonas sp. 5P_3.1_Bac2 TaxID=2971617 RepID=UPI0021C67441|nr:D-glycerate dehydrogenase [Pseudomonas sp. 5P_3.1_Bac2]MCU1715749.1 D-glycerate dehydrogenase [Pseudomonas sp. 5P_3.1_Bac2]
MKKSVVLYKRLSAELMARLHEQVEVQLIDPSTAAGLAQLHDALPKAQGLLGASLKVDDALLSLAPQLEVVSSVSVGVDNYAIEAFNQRGVLLTNTPDVLTETTADTGFALILAAARRVVELDRWIRAGHWQAAIGPSHFGCDVQGKTLGIVGMGRIGEALARRAAAGFGMQVLYHSRNPRPEVEQRYGAGYRSLSELLQQSDFVCLTVPLSPATENLISHEQLALMKPSAILINIARGKVLDEAALIDALQHQRIRGAGLDVMVQEPLPQDSPLLQLDNLVLTPHIGSATLETREAMARCAVDNLLAGLAGERPANLVNPSAWPRRSGI